MHTTSFASPSFKSHIEPHLHLSLYLLSQKPSLKPKVAVHGALTKFSSGGRDKRRERLMLLRNRSRAVTKPTLMADHSSQPSPKPNQNYSTQKFRDHFSLKCLSGSEALISPTSILDTRALSPFGNNPFSYETIVSPRIMHSSEKRSSWDKTVPKGIGLALAGELQDESLDVNSANQTNGKVLFGTQLRVKIPPMPPSTFSPFESQTCAADYGTKTKDSQNSGIYTKDSSPHAVVESLSEMELSEEYTCVKSHGPNPRTTHIFHNCIVENYCSLPNKPPHSSVVNFLSFCYTCKKHLEQTKDIFIYRDRAFCSQECRYQEMVLDDVENSEFDSNDHF